ncbi:hypothetical protein GCM10018793_34050 [Streptomyces sulfonofaciens]|uniref:YwqJ-like deaminase n=1 Tax=Streptomyces sulfonofaciens TaxID=68272 RepID=A0A919G9V5_9ACTN|nr:YwqJ-related putative deaminase [Streptomyces sulfonofaciens]GHH79995.1 hypothetical protein GCM10018793_34050 [Streptomyces sulfonofaciens]
MHTAQTNTGTDRGSGLSRPRAHVHLPGQAAAGSRPGAPGTPAAPQAGRRGTAFHAPVLRHRRDGILPTVAAALSVRGTTLTGTAARGDQSPVLHPLVQSFLDALPSDQRDRFTGRCAETLLISRRLGTADAERSKRARRKPMSPSEARKALKNAKLTARHIREDGDPLHGSFAHPCRACTALAEHLGIRVVDPAAPEG